MSRPQRPSPKHKWVTTQAVFDKDGNLLHEEGYWYLGPWTLAVAMNTQNFNAWRFYDDDGGEAASTPLENQDTNHTLTVDTDQAIQLRVRIDEVGGADGSTMDDYALEYEKNDSTTWSALTTTDSGDGIQAVAAGLTNNNATTNRASPNHISDPGGGSFVAGEQSTDGTVEDVQITASNFTELVFGIQFNNANLSNGDTFDFRFSAASAIDNNNVVPRITISITPPVEEPVPALHKNPQAHYSRFKRTDLTNQGPRAQLPSYPITPHSKGAGRYDKPFVTRTIPSRKLQRGLPTMPWLVESADATVNATAATLTITTGTATVGVADLAASLHRPPTLRSGLERKHLSAKQLPWWSIDQEVTANAATLTITTGTATVGLADIATLFKPKSIRTSQKRHHLSAKQLPWWSIDQEVTATAQTLTITTGQASVGYAALAGWMPRPKAFRTGQERKHLSAKQLPWWSIDTEVTATAATLTITTGQATVGVADLAASLHRPPTLKTEFRRQNKTLPTLPWFVPSADVEVNANAAALTITTGTATVGLADLAASLHRPPTLRSGQERKHLAAKQLPWWSIDQEVAATAATLTIATGTATIGFADLAASLHRPPTLKSGQERRHLAAKQLPWWSIDTEVAATAATLTITTGTATITFTDDVQGGREYPRAFRTRFQRSLKRLPTLEWFEPEDVTVNATAATLTITTGTAKVSFSLDDELAGRTRPETFKVDFRKRLRKTLFTEFNPGLSERRVRSGVERLKQSRAEERRLTPVIQLDSVRRQDDALLLKIIGEFLDKQGRLALLGKPPSDPDL